jgi:uncharacterized membrane protein
VIDIELAGIAALFAVDLMLFVCLPTRREADGWTAVVAGVLAVIYGLLECVYLERFCIVYCALSVWAWWRHGGDGGTRRRLRSLRRAFRGVRRTAPVFGGGS